MNSLMPRDWVYTEDEQPHCSGNYWCKVLPSPFDNDKEPYEELVHYNKEIDRWDAADHMPVYAWEKIHEFDVSKIDWGRNKSSHYK